MINFPLQVKFNDNQYKIEIWDGRHLGNEICCDTETTVAPFHTRDHKLVVFQAYAGGDTIYLIKPDQIKRFFNKHSTSKLIWQNAPFDIQVLMSFGIQKETLLDFYDANLIYDTKILWILYNLAVTGCTPKLSSLKHICLSVLGYKIDKNNDVRTSFDQYLNKPYEEMTYEHLAYASLDVVHTYNAYCMLLSMIEPHDTYNTLLTHHTQVKGDLALNQIYKNGLGVDLEAKDKLSKELEIQVSNTSERLAMWGIVRGKKGIQDMYERAVTRLGIADKLPRTDSGKISSKGSDLKYYKHIQFIKDYLELNENEKLLSFLVNLKDDIIYPTYTTILNTGRTATQKGHNGLSIHQIPRNGGIREVFVPKDKNKVFIDTDYSSVELAGLSQVLITLYGNSRMAEIINSGEDLHRTTAMSIYNVDSPEKVTKDQRQFAKIPNFAYPTNMAPSTFVDYCKQYNIDINEDEAANVKQAWLDAYPEINNYFSDPNGKEDGFTEDGKKTYTHYTITGRKRAKCTYTAYLNTGFQGLCADGLKIALYNLFKLGYHISTEIHDQILIEVDRDKAEFERPIIQKIMVDSMNEVIPDVLIQTESNILERFTK